MVEIYQFRSEAGSNYFVLSPQKWIDSKLIKKIGIEISIKIINAFVNTRKFISDLIRSAKKINKQYPYIEIKEFTNSHDRFLIIDNSAVYHFWASLKDLGKKWFAFSKMDTEAVRMIARLDLVDRGKIGI